MERGWERTHIHICPASVQVLRLWRPNILNFASDRNNFVNPKSYECITYSVCMYVIHTHSGHSISKSKPCVCWDWNETPQLRMLCVCELLCANGDSGVIYYTRVRVLYVFTFERWHTPCTPISSSAELEEGNMENYFRDCLACRWGFSHLSPSTPFALALQTIFAIIFSCFFSAWLQAARAEQNRAEHSGNLYVCHHHRHCGLCSYIYICVCEHDQNRRGIILLLFVRLLRT